MIELEQLNMQDFKEGGGPAFPSEEFLISEDPRVLNPMPHRGMTLRDYFAAMAMQSLLAQGRFWPRQSEVASVAYEVSNAMLVQRDRQ